MQISLEERKAIDDMFRCRNLLEHMVCYQYHLEQLKDWTFVVFSDSQGSKLPDALCTNYDNEFAVINLGCDSKCYAMNKSIYEEMLATGKSNYNIDVLSLIHI